MTPPVPPVCAGCAGCGGPDCAGRPEPAPAFGTEDCTCIPWTRRGGVPRYCGPADTAGPGADTVLVQRIHEALTAAHHEWMRPGSDAGEQPMLDTLAAAVLDALAPALDSAYAETSRANTEARTAREWRWRADDAERRVRIQRGRAEQAEDLLRVAHETSNKSEAERARAVQRAEEAEAQLSLIDAMRQVNLEAAGAGIQRAEEAEAAIARARELHRKANNGDTCVYCAHGQRLGYDTTWPCDTIRALDTPAPTTEETQ